MRKSTTERRSRVSMLNCKLQMRQRPWVVVLFRGGHDGSD